MSCFLSEHAVGSPVELFYADSKEPRRVVLSSLYLFIIRFIDKFLIEYNSVIADCSKNVLLLKNLLQRSSSSIEALA